MGDVPEDWKRANITSRKARRSKITGTTDLSASTLFLGKRWIKSSQKPFPNTCRRRW